MHQSEHHDDIRQMTATAYACCGLLCGLLSDVFNFAMQQQHCLQLINVQDVCPCPMLCPGTQCTAPTVMHLLLFQWMLAKVLVEAPLHLGNSIHGQF